MLRLLVEAKAELNAVDDAGWTAFLVACRQGSADCVEFLVERSTVSSAQGGRRWLAGLCWMCSVLLLAQS